MSEYRHDLRKAADTGLQLRMPVDLVPATQWSRLSNGVPIIEGELRTREGLTQVGVPTEVTFVSSLQTVNPGDATAPLANTIYPHGLVPGQAATIDVTAPGAGNGTFFDTTKTAGSGANDGGGGTAWTNPNNVTSTVAYATVTLGALSVSQHDLCETFGFAAPAIAAFTTLKVTFEAYFVITGVGAPALAFQLLKSGVASGTPQDVAVSPTATAASPQTITLTFDGSAFSNADLNAATSGVQFIAGNTSFAGTVDWGIRNVRLEAIKVTTAFPASYAVTITAVPSATQVQFAPAIPVFIPSGVTLPIFGQITSAQQYNNLPNTIITNLFRLNQALANVPSDRVVAIGGRIWHAILPAGTAFEELIAPLAPGGPAPSVPNSLSGLTLALIEFRFTLDAQSWLLIGDSNQMYKYRSAPSLAGVEFVPLGNAPPTAPATASAGGVGNLNSTGGTDYDWRYTYVDGLAKTESNPSQINFVTGGGGSATETINPSTFVTTTFSPVTNSSGTDSIDLSGGTGTTTQTDTCTWENFPVPATGTINSIQLQVTISATIKTGLMLGAGSTGKGTISVTYSYDDGATFLPLFSVTATGTTGHPANASYASQVYTATIPSSVSVSFVQIAASNTAKTTVSAAGGEAEVITTVNLSDISLAIGVEGVVNALALVNQSADVCVTPSPYPQHTFINLYRRGGSLPDAWRLVLQAQVSTLVQGSCGAGTLLINDNVSDTTLSGSSILELDNDQPVTSVTVLNQPLKFIWGPVGTDARVLGCGDPARPECVYFSKPGNADSWPPQNFIEVSSPGVAIIAGCVYNTRTFAYSREGIYELVEGLGTGTTYTPFRTPSARGLFSPWGLCVGPAMYFISKDGIYESTGGQEVSLVENDIKPLFPTYDSPGRDVEGYEAIDYGQPDAMRLRYHNNELYFIYRGLTTGSYQMLAYDVYKKRWRAIPSTSDISEVYSEPATTSSLLEGTTAGVVYQSGGNMDPLEPGLLLGVAITLGAGVVTLAGGTYNARVSASTAKGEVLLSYDVQGLVVDAVHGIQVTFPAAQPGVTSWRVYYGLAVGLETQFMQFTEAQVAGFVNRTTIIVTAGTAGAPPTLNADPNISVNIRTGAHDQGAPLNQKQYGNVIFDLDPGGATVGAPVTITPYINGEIANQAAITVSGSGRRQVPLDLGDYFAFNTEYEITWTRTNVGGGVVSDPVLFQYDTLHFLEPVAVLHWQAQPTSFGFPGYVHVRDAYIAIRSTSATTLTVTIDGSVVQTYTIASTGGERKKVYVQLASNKGLMYQFAVDSTTNSFRIYEADIEFRVKPWLGLLGYSVQRILGGEVAA